LYSSAGLFVLWDVQAVGGEIMTPPIIPQTLVCKSIREATYRTVKLIMNKGKRGKDERGETVQYYKHVIIVIPCYCCEDSEELLSFICGFAFGKNLITGNPVCFGENAGLDVQDPEYTYGQELHEDGGLDETIRKLKESPKSRRIVNPLFKTKHYGKNEVPCMVTLVWDTEEDEDNDYVNLTILGRSNEMAIAMKNDLRGYAYLLEYVAFQAGLKPGVILLHDINAHCRVGSDMDEIKKILAVGV